MVLPSDRGQGQGWCSSRVTLARRRRLEDTGHQHGWQLPQRARLRRCHGVPPEDAPAGLLRHDPGRLAGVSLVCPLAQSAREGPARGLRGGLASSTGARLCAELHRCRHLCAGLSEPPNPLVGLVQVGLAANGSLPGLLDQIPLLGGEDGSKRVESTAKSGQATEPSSRTMSTTQVLPWSLARNLYPAPKTACASSASSVSQASTSPGCRTNGARCRYIRASARSGAAQGPCSARRPGAVSGPGRKTPPLRAGSSTIEQVGYPFHCHLR